VSSDEQTIAVSKGEENPLSKSSYELRISPPNRDSLVIPLHRSLIRIGPSAECDVVLSDCPHLRLGLVQGELNFYNETLETPVSLQGSQLQSGTLKVGDTLEFAGHQLLFWDSCPQTHYLEGFSPPYVGKLWPITNGTFRIGRGESRKNEIDLDNPTVSRAHATLEVQPDSQKLIAESSTNSVLVNGQALEPGSSRTLGQSDLLEFGSLVFRFHQKSRQQHPKISVASLGSFQCQVGDQTIANKAWKSKPTKWLMARLAYHWGRPASSEAIIEMLWPESDPERGRARLNSAASLIRQILRTDGHTDAEYVLRSSATIQLNPDLLEQNDLLEFKKTLAEANQLRAKGQLDQAQESLIKLLSPDIGPFLDDCDLDWALDIRQTLELEVLATARALLSQRQQSSDYPNIAQIAPLVLKWEPCCQDTYLALMQAQRELAQPLEAVRTYERCCKHLKRELDLEPSLDILKEYHLAQSQL
jgi:DNA-binding SARP family transcriptional activator